MDSQSLSTVIRRLREATAPDDAELLRSFADDRDSAAFTEVVRRHGPMVLGVCRRVLGNTPDADDAFQATFIVLVRKVATLKKPDRLAGWLHQVALRTAKKLRATRATRRAREGELPDVPAHEATADFIWRELKPIFDEELSRLPDRLRLPAVLCFLEGCSKAEASRMLGWPEGTLSGRLQRAREWLRKRFTARGLTLSSGALAVVLFDAVGSAAVPARLIDSTIHQMLTGAPVPAGVRALAEGVTQAMFLAKIKTVAAGVLMAGVIGTGTGVVMMPGNGPHQVVAGEPAGEQKAKKSSSPPPTIEVDNLQNALKRTQGTINDDRVIMRGQLMRSLELRLRIHEDILLIQERLAYEERMVKKGFMSEAQMNRTKLQLAQKEAELAKALAPKAPDPRQKALEELIQKMEEIVAQTEEGVRKGIVPRQELLNAQMRVLEYKFKLAGGRDRPPTPLTPEDEARRRKAYEITIQKLEEIVRQTAEGVKKGIIPLQELLNSQGTLERYKFDLAEMEARSKSASESPRDSAGVQARLKAAIQQKKTELARAEALLKQKVASAEEVRRLRIDLNRLKAEAATAAGDHKSAFQYTEAATKELEARLDHTKSLVDRGIASRAELRLVEDAVAEGKIDVLRAGIRKQLADIVAIREQELREAKSLFEAEAISAEEVKKTEQALQQARLRLAGEP